MVVSPDTGGVGRARAMAEALNCPLAIIAKRRPEPNKVEVMEIIGDVSGKVCLMVDDIIDTAGSTVTGACALLERGATSVYASATHGVLSGPALERIEDSPIRQLIVTDTIPLPAHAAAQTEKLRVVSVAPLLANAIRRIHEDSSVSELFDKFW